MRIINYFIVVIAILISGCSVNYSFTGASISPDIKTFSVEYFPNFAPLSNPNLSQQLTESIKDYFISQTNLKLVERNGDLQFSGQITDYRTQYKAVTSGETAALNELIISIKVKYVNTKDETQNFEQPFKRFQQYDSSQNLADVEDQLVEEINAQLIQDIFSKSVGNW